MSKPRNVVLLVADSLRYDSVYKGDKGIPYIENNATQFTNVSSSACWTLPATSCLFTGQLPHEHGATAQSRKIVNHARTLGEQMQSQGYKTYQITANVATSEIFGLDRGFDQVIKTWELDEWKGNNLVRLLVMMGKPRIRKKVMSKDFVAKSLSKDLEAGSVWVQSHMQAAFDKAHELIKFHNDKNEKCFLFINLMETHFPYHINHSFKLLNKGPLAAFREIKALFNTVNQTFLIKDKLIKAKALADLKKRQQKSWDLIANGVDQFAKSIHEDKENLFVFHSDHGDNFGDQDWVYHFSNVTDACTRVPLFWLDHQSSEAKTLSHPLSSRFVYHQLCKAIGISLEEQVNLFTEDERQIPISQSYWYNNRGKTLDKFKYNQMAFTANGKRWLFRQNKWFVGMPTDYTSTENEQFFEEIKDPSFDIDGIGLVKEQRKYVENKLEAFKKFEAAIMKA